jgi:hypothetical protein
MSTCVYRLCSSSVVSFLDMGAKSQRYGDDQSVPERQHEHVIPAKRYVFQKAAHPAHRLSLGGRSVNGTDRHRMSGCPSGMASTGSRIGGVAEQGGELIRGLLDLPSRALQPSAETELGRRDVERSD